MSFDGKTAVITGGIGGIGLATARHLLLEGLTNLALVDIVEHEEKVNSLKECFKHANIIFLTTDITNRDVVEQTFQAVLQRFPAIDIVVNSAGIVQDREIQLLLNTNLLGLINSSLVAMKAMSEDNKGRGGVIANISSVAGITTFPGLPVYCASKHGVVGFTQAMAHDCYYEKHGVKFLTICPGVTETPLVSDLEEQITFPESREATMKMVETIPLQTADACGKCISTIIATAQNGSLWIVDDGKIEEFSIQKYWKL